MGVQLFLLALTSSQFLEALKWAAIVGVAVGAVIGAYRWGRTRDSKLAAVARQVGADLIVDETRPDPPALTEQLSGISAQLRAVPGQINSAILGAEARLGARIQSLNDVDLHIMKEIADDRKVASAHRAEVLTRIGQLETTTQAAARRAKEGGTE